jgi:hypothetical protein
MDSNEVQELRDRYISMLGVAKHLAPHLADVMLAARDLEMTSQRYRARFAENECDRRGGEITEAQDASIKWAYRARTAEAELRTLRTGLRANGADPTQIQNLWAQISLRNRQWREARQSAEKAEAARDKLATLVRDLTDPEPCRYDHHGGCQEHGYLSLENGERCPHAEAKEVLASLGIELED